MGRPIQRLVLAYKYKKNYTTIKEKYGERIRLASKNFGFNASKNVKDEEEEKKEKEKTEKERKLKLKRHQEYIERLFSREEEERRERIRRREEEKAKLRMEVKEEIRSYVENSDSSDDIAKSYPFYRENAINNVIIRPFCPQFNTNFEGFKTIKVVRFFAEKTNLGKGFLEIFLSFGDMITGMLGIKAETKESEIGGYLSDDIEKSMQTTKVKLREILEKNGKYEKVKTVVEQFISGTVEKIAAGAKEAAKGAAGDDAIGGAPIAV
ncbi:hypothetical protein BDCR2A_01520 [Borrelia duttonii CR2A]|uniref:Variable large protein n=1 Tax=Borrelia duttonii CR2A TaxID=1432657 RepID=W6TWW5_9SPIR|nr:hypothetical protein BDCR2A_01520 [Borrelia duttonii CR2A]